MLLNMIKLKQEHKIKFFMHQAFNKENITVLVKNVYGMCVIKYLVYFIQVYQLKKIKINEKTLNESEQTGWAKRFIFYPVKF